MAGGFRCVQVPLLRVGSSSPTLPNFNCITGSSPFHPLTNRKHHCRLCGQIICSLPTKHPQRPDLCSILFIVDSKTRKIEEVGQGVDYGVRKRRNIDPKRKGKQKEDPLSEDEKFLKGVRICKSCKPILA